MNIRLKELSKLGYTNNIARSIAVNVISRYCKHEKKEKVIAILTDLLQNPEKYKSDNVWSKLAEHFSPTVPNVKFTAYDLLNEPITYKIYGNNYIENLAKQQMKLAMRLPVTLAGALMPDAHAGYGLPIGGVIAVENAVIPYAVGVDIGCRMSLSILNVKTDYFNRYSQQIKKALIESTHFGMEGGISFQQEHEILDSQLFNATPLLKKLHGKAVRQLGSSGGGNHFVEFGEIELIKNNILNLPAGNYMALLSHSGSRGLGAEIAKYYSQIARDVCHLPREAQHFAWLNLDSEAGQEYWLSMNLAGDYARACHERIHINLCKALGLNTIGNVNNHHNFAWEEEIANGKYAIVHRKGATPAAKGVAGYIPGNMVSEGYLVCGKGDNDSLNSASHGAGRAMSRQKAKEQFSLSSMKKLLTQKQVTLIGGTIEEMPLAYKDINRVMLAQEPLVEIHGRFTPRIVRMNKE